MDLRNGIPGFKRGAPTAQALTLGGISVALGLIGDSAYALHAGSFRPRASSRSPRTRFGRSGV